MNNENLKSWLRRYSNYKGYVNHLLTEREALEAEILSAPISKQDSMPRASSTSDRTGNGVARLDVLEREIAEAENKRDQAYAQISAAINRIGGKDWHLLRATLRLRYLCGKGWPEICGELWLDRSDYLEREESYSRRTFVLHRRALDALAKIVEVEDSAEIPRNDPDTQKRREAVLMAAGAEKPIWRH